MGADIHGVWECRLPNGTWVAFREINRSRNYNWFGILSGVREDGPMCDSIEWDPRREYDVGEYWLSFCQGGDLHSHTLVSIPALRQANEALHRRRAEWNLMEDAEDDREPEPSLNEIVKEIWLGARVEKRGTFDVRVPNTLGMGIPLREVLGLGPEARIEDAFGLLRMVIAYD